MHAAHGGAHQQTEMVDLQSVGKQKVLQVNHVIVGIVRKLGVQAVAGLGGVTMPYVVGKDDEIAARIQKLPGTEEDASKAFSSRSEEHTSELQSHSDLVCSL